MVASRKWKHEQLEGIELEEQARQNELHLIRLSQERERVRVMIPEFPLDSIMRSAFYLKLSIYRVQSMLPLSSSALNILG